MEIGVCGNHDLVEEFRQLVEQKASLREEFKKTIRDLKQIRKDIQHLALKIEKQGERS